MATLLHVVTGILGSGKTTVLRHLLEGPTIEPRRAVVVGEYAESGFDGDMIRASGADVFQVTGAGVREAERYVDEVRRLVLEGRHPRVFLETSGATRIREVARALSRDPVVRDRALFGRSVTVLDAGAFEAHDRHFPAQLWAQVDVADLVVVNKTDKVHEAALGALRDRVLERHPGARVLMSYMGQIRRQEVMGDLPEDFSARVLGAGDGEDPPAEFESFVYTSDLVCFDRVTFGHRLLNLPGGHIARFKGVLRSYDRSHCVNGLPGQLDWDSTPVSGPTSIAFIGLGLEARRQAIADVLDRELASQQADPR